jgi:hypothetical protein
MSRMTSRASASTTPAGDDDGILRLRKKCRRPVEAAMEPQPRASTGYWEGLRMVSSISP